jgi:hypothetical protein
MFNDIDPGSRQRAGLLGPQQLTEIADHPVEAIVERRATPAKDVLPVRIFAASAGMLAAASCRTSTRR